MMIEVGATCALMLVETELQASNEGWTESVAIQLKTCGKPLDLDLPPGVRVDRIKGRVKFADDKVKLDDTRYERLPRGIDGQATWRVHLPEVGGILSLELTRSWPAGPFRWEPGGAYASLVTPKGSEVALQGALKQDKKVWGKELGEGDTALVTWPAHPVPDGITDLSPLPRAEGVEHRRKLVVEIPGGDPQIALHPGGGSTVLVEDNLAFQPAEDRRRWLLPLQPEASDLEVVVEPDDGAVVHRWGDALGIEVLPSEGPTRISTRYRHPDAPTCGVVDPQPGESLEVAVSAPGGSILWERDGRAWWLAEWKNRPILPDRVKLVRGLDFRFGRASLPEPGLPLELKGMRASWDLAARLRPTLAERARVHALAGDPLFPRKLAKARKSGAISSLEAALILRLYAGQSRLPSDWVAVRPANEGTGFEVCPIGYDEGLLRIVWKGEERWIDPSCEVCGPFEIRPSLQGASALGRQIRRTPDPIPGRWTVEHDNDGTVRWLLSGTAATWLRLWIADHGKDALQERMGVSAIEEASGRAGEPLLLAGPSTDEPGDTPLPEAGWLHFVGERIWIRPTLPDDYDHTAATEAVAWERELDPLGGTTTERWTVEDRRLSPEDADVLDAARSAPPPQPEPEPEPEEPTPESPEPGDTPPTPPAEAP